MAGQQMSLFLLERRERTSEEGEERHHAGDITAAAAARYVRPLLLQRRSSACSPVGPFWAFTERQMNSSLAYVTPCASSAG